MSVDTRSWAWCSLGQLTSDPVTLAESHIQGSGGGVIKVTGTVNLYGIYRPNPGDPVFFAASNGQWISRLPRKLRVIDSFADPLRKVTTVSVGCKFAYLENRKAPIDLYTIVSANPSVNKIEREKRVQTISAKSVTEKILQELGLTAAGSIPFTNHRIITSWDLSAGYIQELAKIAESECYRCWLNENEQVEFIDLKQGIGLAPLLTEDQLVDISPQTVGELPAEAVFSQFSYSILNPQPRENDRFKRHWELDQSTSAEQYIYTGPEYTETGVFMASRTTETEYDSVDRVKRKTETSIGLTGTTTTTTEYTYEAPAPPLDANGDPIPPDENADYTVVGREEFSQLSPVADIASSCGFEGSLGELRALGRFLSARRVTEYDRDPASGITKTVTRNYVPFVSTPFGSEAIRNSVGIFSVNELIANASALVEYKSDVSIRTEREFGLRRRPGEQERNLAADGKHPKFQQQTSFVWLAGSATTQTRLELSPPYVPDDRMEPSLVDGAIVWTHQPSDAPQKALDYARVENRLLLGNRSGAGIQVRLIDMPVKPFDLFYLRLNGCTAAYRANGMTWTISSKGIVVSIDALFYGAIDGTINNAWFPLPPGLTALPSSYAVTTNSNPLPANAITAPTGFNPTTADISTLFASLPFGSAPTPGATLNPSRIVAPYQETLPIDVGLEIGAIFEIAPPILPNKVLTAGIDIGLSLSPVPSEIALIAGLEIGLSLSQPEASPVIFQAQMTGSNGSTTFTDLSPNAIAITTNGNAQVNGNELLLDGIGDYLYAADEALILPGNTLWTLETFVTPTQIAGLGDIGVFSIYSDSSVNQSNETYVWSSIAFAIVSGVWHVGNFGLLSTGVSASLNTKVHIAIIGKGNESCDIYISGNLIGDFLYSEFWDGTSASKLLIGRVHPDDLFAYTDSSFKGKIGPFRISTGQLYSGSSFTPPTSIPTP